MSSGAVQMTSRYGAYGLVRSSSGGAVSDYRYTGQRQESLGNNWIYDYGARFYDALIGRFLSADSIVPGAGNPQALNRYSYTLNNPVKYTDPTGHCPSPSWLCVIGAVTGLNQTVWHAYGDLYGLSLVTDYKDVIKARGTTQVPAIAIAAGIAQQAEFSWDDSIKDLGELIGLHSSSHRGIAKLGPEECNCNPRDPQQAIAGMAAKIAPSVKACTNCTTTDKWIVMGLAQNGFAERSVQRALEYRATTTGAINWSAFFADNPGSGPFSIGQRLEGIKGWNRYILHQFVVDLIDLVAMGWELPSDVDIRYMDCVSSGGSDCEASKPDVTSTSP